VTEGPLAITVKAEGKLLGGAVGQTIRFYRDHPRIDFETEVKDIPDKTVVLVEFPLAEPILETRRGIPFGFSHGAWSKPNPQLAGFADGILAAIRWSHYQSARGGVALLDRGLPGRELTGNTPTLLLLNALDIYMGYPCAWLSGRGKQRLSYALMAHDGDWKDARIPQQAWEFNAPPVVLAGVGQNKPCSFVSTSDNVIVEALRREGADIELRLVECLGRQGTATVCIGLLHGATVMTDLTGNHPRPLDPGPEYRLPVRPQQIVTLRLKATQPVPAVEPLRRWDALVPEKKREALNRYVKNRKGHPPAGDGSAPPILPDDVGSSLTLGKKAKVSNVYHNMPAHGAGMAVDADPGTRWACDAGVFQGWLEVDLGKPETIGRAYLSEAYDRVREFELQHQREGQWQTFARGTTIGVNKEMTFDPVTARIVRLNVRQATDGPTLWEFHLFRPKK
jgi:hypothetical protein